MDYTILKEYLESRLCWPNKETTPHIKINNIKNSTENICINHDVLFCKIGSSELKKYLSSIECTVWKSDVSNFIRERNLNILL